MVSERRAFGGSDLLMVASEGGFVGALVGVVLTLSTSALKCLAVAFVAPELVCVAACLPSGFCGFVGFERSQCVFAGSDPGLLSGLFPLPLS